MKIFRDLAVIPKEYQGAVVTLGNFDGLHLGHRAIISKAKSISKAENIPLALMTFEPHPREFFSKNKNGEALRIYSLRSKLMTIKSLGVDCVFLARFNKQLIDLSADKFIKDVLVDKLQAKYVVTGENFCFGKDRQGDKNLLSKFASIYNFEYVACQHSLGMDGNSISSSAIRSALKNGEIKKINHLLSKHYHISGHVRHGEGRGSRLGFPTANIVFGKLFIPCYGVYAVLVGIDNLIYNGVANIGVKPTFGINSPLLEVHVFDLEQDLYGKRLYVEFVDFIRPELKFSSIDMLKEQIHKDCKAAMEILA